MEIDLSLEDIRGRFLRMDMNNAVRLTEVCAQRRMVEIGSSSIVDPAGVLDQLHLALSQEFGLAHRPNPINVIERQMEKEGVIVSGASQDLYLGGRHRFAGGEVRQITVLQSLAMISIVSSQISKEARELLENLFNGFVRILDGDFEEVSPDEWDN